MEEQRPAAGEWALEHSNSNIETEGLTRPAVLGTTSRRPRLSPMGRVQTRNSRNGEPMAERAATFPTAFRQSFPQLCWHTVCTPVDARHRETRNQRAWAG